MKKLIWLLAVIVIAAYCGFGDETEVGNDGMAEAIEALIGDQEYDEFRLIVFVEGLVAEPYSREASASVVFRGKVEAITRQGIIFEWAAPYILHYGGMADIDEIVGKTFIPMRQILAVQIDPR